MTFASHTVFQSVTSCWPSEAWTILRWTWVASENDSEASNHSKSYFISTSAFALQCTVPGNDDLMTHPGVGTSVLVHWKLLWWTRGIPAKMLSLFKKKRQELYTQMTVSLTFPCWVAGCIWMLYVGEFNAQYSLFLELVCSGWCGNNLPSLNLASLSIILLWSIYPISTCSL